MNTVLYRFNKLKTICNIIYKDLNNYYDFILDNKTETNGLVNNRTLSILALAKEKIIELEKEINNVK